MLLVTRKHLTEKRRARERAERLCIDWLFRANDLRSAGKRVAAEKAYDKAQYWFDRCAERNTAGIA